MLVQGDPESYANKSSQVKFTLSTFCQVLSLGNFNSFDSINHFLEYIIISDGANIILVIISKALSHVVCVFVAIQY